MTLNLRAGNSDCLPGQDIVSASASGVLPLTLAPVGVMFGGNLSFQNLTVESDFPCQRTYSHKVTYRRVSGKQHLQIRKENPTAFLSLMAILPGLNVPV